MATKKRYTLETVLDLIDGVTRTSKTIIKSVTQLSDSVSRDFKKAQLQVIDFTKNFQNNLVTGVKRGLAGLAVAITVGLGAASVEYTQFQDTLIQANTKFGQITTEQAKQLEQSARDIGATTEFTSKQAAEALSFWAMAGASAEQSMALLRPTVDLATSSNMELALASDLLSDSLGSLGLMTKDTEQLIKNATRTNDIFAATAAATNTTVEGMAGAVKIAGPVFVAAKQQVENLATVYGRMAANGIKNEQAGTAMRGGMLRLMSPVAEVTKALELLGVETRDESGTFRDIIDILSDLEASLGDVSQAEADASLKAIFGVNAFSAWAAVLNEGVDQSRELRDQLLQATGANEVMAETMRTQTSKQIDILKSGLMDLGFQFVETFEQDGKNLLQNLIEVVQDFDMDPIISAAEMASEAIKFLIDVVTPLTPVILSVVAAMIVYKGVMLAAAAANALFIALNPLAWVGAAIIAVGLLIGIIIKFRKEIANAFKIALEWVKAVALSFQENLGVWIDNIRDKISEWKDTIVDTFTTFRDWVVNTGKTILDFLLTPLSVFLESLAKIPKFGKAFSGIAEGLSDFRQTLQIEPTSPGREISPDEPTIKETLETISKEERESRFRAEINLNNLPPGTTIEREGEIPDNMRLNLGTQ